MQQETDLPLHIRLFILKKMYRIGSIFSSCTDGFQKKVVVMVEVLA